MSKSSGDKARSKKSERRRGVGGCTTRNCESRRKTRLRGERLLAPARDGDRIVASQLRRVTRDSKDGSDQDEDVLEIVVYRTQGIPSDQSPKWRSCEFGEALSAPRHLHKINSDR